MPPKIFRSPAGAALYDPGLIDEDELGALMADRSTKVGAHLPGAAGRSGVSLIERNNRQWIWRHNCRGGWCSRISRDAYLWLGEARTRTFREWHLLHRMFQAGLPVPAPVAAFYQRTGLTYRCDLLTTYLPGTASLGSHLARGPIANDTWTAIRECIRHFHSLGVCHADLNAHNILLGANNTVYLVDFDRGRTRRPGRWMEGNRRRLERSIAKITGQRDHGAASASVVSALRTQ